MSILLFLSGVVVGIIGTLIVVAWFVDKNWKPFG